MSTVPADYAAYPARGFFAILARIGDAFCAACERTERSHHRRLGHAFLRPEDLRDIGMSAEDATGLPSRQPDLPFFMQTDFDRR